MLAAEHAARRETETRASGAGAMVAHLKPVIAKLEHHRYGASSERGRKPLKQAELQLEELEADAAEETLAAKIDAGQADARGSRSPRAKRRNAPGEMSSRIASPLAPIGPLHVVDQKRIAALRAASHHIRVSQDARRYKRLNDTADPLESPQLAREKLHASATQPLWL